MKTMHRIIDFYNRYILFPERMYFGLIAAGCLSAVALILLNQMDLHYTISTLLATNISAISWLQAAGAIALGIFFSLYGMYIKNESPRSSTFILGLGLFFWCALTNYMIAFGIQATPFPPIDHLLLKIDQLLGVHSRAIMAWTYTHHWMHRMLEIAYASLIIQLVTIPILLSIFNARQSMMLFYIAELSTLLVGCGIYFFFPTTAPSGILHTPYFSTAQIDTSLRFFEVHHYLPVTQTDGGLIAFPSFHVIWAILLTYCIRSKKIFFYPLALWNSLVIASTVLLGWHYLTDVIGGMILAVLGIVFAHWVCRKNTLQPLVSTKPI